MDWIILITIVLAWIDIRTMFNTVGNNQQIITDNQKKLEKNKP